MKHARLAALAWLALAMALPPSRSAALSATLPVAPKDPVGASLSADTLTRTLTPWLPPSQTVGPVLRASPHLQAARAMQQAQEQRARGLEAGMAEWAVRFNQQQRRAQDPQARWPETTLTLERPLRLWGKARLDAQLAAQDREVAGIGLADALHEASRQLLGQWFDALRTQLDADSAEREWQLARSLDLQARVRLRQGDISALDARLAEADLQRSHAHLQLALAAQAHQRALLRGLYPGLPEPQWPQEARALPETPIPNPPVTVQDFLEHHHELRLLRAQAQRQQQLAERLERERWPDPSVGVYATRERAGAEQLIGVAIAMPLSGVWRQSQAHAALAEAQGLAHAVTQRERELQAQFEARWQQLAQQQQALGELRAAAATQRLAAEKSLIAYTLGEHSMTELIQNRRLANEQQLASQRLWLDVLLRLAQIALDAHRLWDLQE